MRSRSRATSAEMRARAGESRRRARSTAGPVFRPASRRRGARWQAYERSILASVAIMGKRCGVPTRSVRSPRSKLACRFGVARSEDGAGHDKICSMRVGVAQLDQIVGDFSGNAKRILDAIGEARHGGADLVVTPELSLCGYPPEDLLLRRAFLSACADELSHLAAAVSGVTALVGFPETSDGKRYNAVAVLRDGRIAGIYRKQWLPNYTVFDEQRYFEPGDRPCDLNTGWVKVGGACCAE